MVIYILKNVKTPETIAMNNKEEKHLKHNTFALTTLKGIYVLEKKNC